LTKIPLTYSVSYFDLGGLGALFWVAKPIKAHPWRRDYSAEQVLCLLLHLAIRYTPKTPIKTYLSAARLC